MAGSADGGEGSTGAPAVVAEAVPLPSQAAAGKPAPSPPKAQAPSMSALHCGDSHDGQRLRVHAAMIGQVRSVLSYEFPGAVDSCVSWATNLKRSASSPGVQQRP